MTFRKSNKAYKKAFAKEDIPVNIISETHHGVEGRYLELIVDKNAPTLLFVHGAPGSSSAFTNYLKDSTLNSAYNLVIIDRLGYGYSDYGNYHTISQQAEWIGSLIEKHYANNPVFLIGHSFGGPIVAQTTYIMKGKISGTIMIAPAIDPENEKYFFGGKLAYWKPTKWLFSKPWQVSASEKYQHAAELKLLEANWSKIETPVLHIHGDKDKIAPFINLAYTTEQFNPNYFKGHTWQGEGHLIPFKQMEKTIGLIQAFIKSHEATNP